ncbi:hypothetical protein ID866_4745 [Astraeus odoratus]|nr:hypothetical protein ID866_4745 [Astraeus odoratus]
MPADNSEKSDNDKTCTSLLIDIVSIREHSSTDRTPEYRVLIDPTALVDRAASGVRGIRPPLDVPSASDDLGHAEHGGEEVEGDEAATDNDEVSERLETAAQAKAKKTTKRTRSTPASPTEPLRLWLPAVMVHAVAPDLVNGYEEKLRKRALKKIQKGTKGKALDKASTTCNAIGMDTTDGDSIRVARSTKLKATAPIVGTSIGRGRRKPNGVAELQDEGYEYFDLNDASPCSEGDSDDRSRVPPAARKKKTATVKMPSQSKSTVKDFFSTTKPSTSTVTTTTRSSAFVPKLPSSIYDELDEDPPHKPLTATNLTSTRPLDIICSRTKEKSRDSLKRRSKSLVRKPLAYVEVSSDEIEIDENKLSGNTTAPSTSPIRKRTDEKEDTSSKQGKPQALVTNFFVASKRANESDSKARSKGTVAISGSKLTHIHLPYAEKELSDSDQDTGKNNRKESRYMLLGCGNASDKSKSRDIAHLNPPRGRPAPRPFPIPPPNIAASSVGSEGGAGTTEDMGVFNAPLASVLPSPLTCSRSSPSYEEVLSDSDGSKILPTAKSPQISVTQTLPSYCANRRSSGSLSTVSFGLRDHGATIRPLSEDIEGCGSVDRSEQVIDETVIYISSGSDEEMDDTGADGADVGMILSAPPALSEPESEPRPSKFKPAVGPITKVTKEATRGEYKVPETMLAPTQIAEKEAKNLGSRQKLNDISVGVTKANIPPLLVARAKADANRAASKASVSTKSTKPTHNARPKLLISEDDFIDLT